jgi:PAS domain S-box-containing protein
MAAKLTYSELEQRVKALEEQGLDNRRLSEALKESEEKAQVLTENSWCGVIILQKGLVKFANTRFSRMVGYKLPEILGHDALSFIHPDDRDMVDLKARGRLKGKFTPPFFNIRLLKKNGNITWADCIFSLGKFQNQTAIIVNLVDISDRKRAEEGIQNAYAELNQIFHTAADAMRVIDKKYYVLRVNNTFSSLTGVPNDEAVGKKCYEIFSGPLCHTSSCPLSRILAGDDRVTYQVEKERNDGRKIPCILTAVPFKGAKGELIGIIEDFKDITERVQSRQTLQKAYDEMEQKVVERTAELIKSNEQLKQEINERKRVELALRESEGKYKTIAENSLTGVFIHQDEKYVFVNDQFAKIHGYTPEELIGKHYLTLIHPDERETIFQIALNRLNGESGPNRYEVRRLSRNNETIWCEMMATAIEYKGKRAIMGNIMDITERKHAEEKLLTYQEQLRSLASELSLIEERERRQIAVALHDRIGQTLAISKMKLGALRESMSSSDLAEAIEKICNLIEQAIQETRSMTLELSPPILYELGFEPAVEWLTEQIQKQNHIEIFLEDDGQPKPLDDDIAFLLFRALKELLINVTKHAQAQQVKVSLAIDVDELRISVEDDGVGFDTGNLDTHILKNGGFGLFSIRERLSHLDGHLEVVSEPGQGTLVTLVMPLRGDGERSKEEIT